MKKFHDVEIYSGTRLATTASRLEIGVKSKFLLEIFSGLADCDRCKEPLVLIFPEEEESTLREVFNRLSHFKSGFSIIESKSVPIMCILYSNVSLVRPCQSELPVGEIDPHCAPGAGDVQAVQNGL